MLYDTLVKTILTELERTCTPAKAKHVSVALSTLEEFTTLCNSVMSFHKTEVQQSLLFASCAPAFLDKKDELPYALFVLNLFTKNECYGMVHEDPLNSLVLIGGAYQIVHRYTIEDPNHYVLVEAGLDLLFLQATALFVVKEYTLARQSLTTILEVASEVDKLEQRCNVESKEVGVDVTIRAAPSAWMMACIFRESGDNNGAYISLNLANDMYKELVKQDTYLYVRQTHVSTLIGFAEVLTVRERYEKCAVIIDRAIKVATAGLQQDEATAPQAYLASAAYHKRAELYSLSREWDRALECFQLALSWCAAAVKKAPHNTFYDDRHTEYMNELGILHGIRGNLVEAQEVFLRTIKRRRTLAAQAEQHKNGLVAALNNMSTLMSRYGNLEVAKQYLKESIDVIDAMTDTFYTVDRQDLRKSLTHTLQSIENTQKEQAVALWRPIWTPSSATPLPN